MPLGLTGFEPTTYDEWLLTIQTKLRQDLGENIDLSTGSFIESFAESLARQLATSDLTKQDIYDSRFPSLAEGISLDRLASTYGISRGAAAYASAIITIKGTPGFVVDAKSMFSNNEDRYYVTEEEVTIGLDGTINVKVHAEEVGEEYNCAANTITDQVSYVEEIEEVTNPEVAAGGADMETDYDLRKRIRLAEKTTASSSPDGVSSAIFSVPAVKSVRLTTNNSAVVNDAGDPPYTSHIYVLGGDPSAVAQAISDSVAFGITLTGSQKIDVPLQNGDVNHVAFSSGVGTNIFINLSVTLEQSQSLDKDVVIEDIKDNIQVWLDDVAMGDKLRYTQLFTVIYDVDGVSNVTDLSWGTDKDDLAKKDIQLANFSVAEATDDSIGVTING